MPQGFLYIIGAGPGDPELVTVKALKCIKKCDVIFYDATVDLSLFEECKDTVELIRISETITDNPVLPDELNKQIIMKAREGNTVGIVQEGDPFIFGLGAEIGRAASRENIPFGLVPGITSAIAAAAYAGIPLTYRGYSSTLVFATGHTDLNKKYADVDWQKVATGVSTLVFFMGIDNLKMIVDKMIEHGRDPRTPAAIVSCGTQATQETIASTLGEIAAKVELDEVCIKVPAIIIIGDVVGLRDELNWFENVRRT